MILILYKDLLKILETQIAPKRFKKSSEFYGIQYGDVNSEKIIKKVLITVNLNLKVLYFAIKNEVSFIISHLPLIERPTLKINKYLINKLNILSRYPLCIYVLNSAFIASENGVSETISKMLYLKVGDVLEISDLNGNQIPLGRICYPQKYQKCENQFLLRNLLKRINSHFNLELIPYTGELEHEITKICIIPSETNTILFIKKALEHNCDALITSNINYKQAIFAKEMGICLISIPYYNTIYFTLKKVYNYLSLEFPNDLFYFFEQVNPIDYFNT